MEIYWLFLFLSFILLFCGNYFSKNIYINGFEERRSNYTLLLPFFSVIVFFCGLRSGVADTGTYIAMFENWPSKVSEIDWSKAFSDKGFYYITVLFKEYVSDDFQGWLFIIALVSCLATMIALKKYSSDIGLSCFLFIASTTFVYLINGMRQYIVIAIMFACSYLIVERKLILFVILVVILSTIHGSAFILIPFYFANRIKPFSLRMWLVVFGGAIAGVYLLGHSQILSMIVEDTHYEGYVDLLTTSATGVNIYRLLIAMVPCILSVLGKDIILEHDSPIINLSVFSAFLTMVLYLMAMFSNGMVVGRILIYFEIYNIILLPWLIQNVFTEKSAKIIKVLCVIAYSIFFYIQMVLTWDIGYESSFLNLFL